MQLSTIQPIRGTRHREAVDEARYDLNYALGSLAAGDASAATVSRIQSALKVLDRLAALPPLRGC